LLATDDTFSVVLTIIIAGFIVVVLYDFRFLDRVRVTPVRMKPIPSDSSVKSRMGKDGLTASFMAVPALSFRLSSKEELASGCGWPLVSAEFAAGMSASRRLRR
jgi:hypothetical protein